MARKTMNKKIVAVGNISDVSGKITIAGRDVYEGYTAEQVSLLLKEITTDYRRKPFDGRCPYKGLEVFEEQDANLFFGRERLVDDLLSRVKESQTVFITGPSGSGKSSLVRAGLIHALKQGAIKNIHSERWLYETMKPGREPIKELSLAFSRLKSPELAHYFQSHANDINILNECAESVLSGQKTQRFVLFIDQFEEVFTQINGEEERQAFINMLAHAGTVENGRMIVLFAMRSDFVSNCATYPALNELLSQQFRQIGAMQPEELVSAIALPAKEVGLPIEDDLIARIINDMKGEPGALPLMQFALKDLFDSQQAKGGVSKLTLADYLKHGGIQKSLERHADDSLAALDEEGQTLARSIFTSLIEIGRGTQDTKRTALFEELVPANASTVDVLAIVQKLADARLIITDEHAGKDTVTISHEKLIDAWPWLKKLVDENRDVIALQNEIANDAKEWDDHKRDPSYLYSGARLINANELLKSNKLVISGTAFEYIRAGQARQRRSRSAIIGSLATVIVLLIITVIIFASLTREARIQSAMAQTAISRAYVSGTNQAYAESTALQDAQIARVGELAAQSVSLRERNILLSLLLGVEAFRKTNGVFTSVQAQSALLDNAQVNPQLEGFLTRHSDVVRSIAFSPDGRILASGSDDSTIILWDMETHQPIGQPLRGHSDGIRSVAFSPDGRILASGSDDSTIILWNVETQQPIGQPLRGHSDGIRSVAFSPDGRILASGSDDSTIILWNVETQQPIGQPLRGHSDGIRSVAFSLDGKILASGSDAGSDAGSDDSTIVLWDMETQQPIGEPLRGYSDQVSSINSIAFSPDGKILASGHSDANIFLWDVETQRPIKQPLSAHTGSVNSIAFSPDGRILASGSDDSTIILWDMETQQPIGLPLSEHTGGVTTVAFSPASKRLASGGFDNAIILWDVEIQQPIGQPLSGHTRGVNSVAFSPDGKILASGSVDSAIILWDMETHQPIGQPLRGHSGVVNSVAFSPDGKTLLALVSSDHDIILWNVETQQPIGQPLSTHTGSVNSVAFSPNSKTLASVNSDNTIILWNVETQQPIGQPLRGHSDGIRSVAFSLDGKILAAVNSDNTIVLWDVETQQPIGQPLRGHSDQVSSINSIAFSPDGKILASGHYWDANIFLWDVETQRPIKQPLSAHTGSVNSVAFSPDGRILASGSDDSTIILWDMETQQPIGQPLSGHTRSVNSVVFSPDSKTLASGGDDNAIILWDVDPKSWAERSCLRAGRNFTRAEWQKYFPGEEYRKTCEQWPLEPEITAATLTALVTQQILSTMEFTLSMTPLSTPSLTPSPEPTATVNPSALININTASLAELDTLPGIDSTTAQYIFVYRVQNGPFVSIEDIINVSGIGPGTYERIKNLITVLININTASLAELDTLPGIGPTTAQNIIVYRTQNGPFVSIEDIINVTGIGPGTYERIKNLIAVGP